MGKLTRHWGSFLTSNMHGKSSQLRRGTNRLDIHRDFRERELKLNKSITNKVAAILYMKF